MEPDEVDKLKQQLKQAQEMQAKYIEHPPNTVVTEQGTPAPEVPLYQNELETAFPIQQFTSGAIRDATPLPAYHLICPTGERRLAMRYTLGAGKYASSERGGDNYTLGIPYSNLIQHIRHHLNLLDHGDTTDDHPAAIAWGAFTIMHFEEDCRHYEARQNRERRFSNPGGDEPGSTGS